MTARTPPGGLDDPPGLVHAVCSPRETLRDFDAAWSRRIDQIPEASFFSGPVFQNALDAAFPTQPQVASIAAYQGHTLVGWLPLCMLPAPKGLRETGFPRNAHTLRNHLLTDDPAVIAAMLEAWRDHTEADTLVLENLPFCELLAGSLTGAARQMGLLVDTPTRGRSLDFAELPSSYDDFLTSRSGQFRRQTQKRLRQLHDAGRFQIDRLSGDDLALAVPEWQSVVARSWQGQDRTARGGNTASDWRLHRALTGNGYLWLARLDNQPIAALRMLEDRKAAYVHTMHFDQALRAHAPGLVLFDAMMRDACARGVPRVDFNGTSEFFLRWATGNAPHMSIRIYRASLRGRGAKLIRSVSRRLRSGTKISQHDGAAPETPPGQPA
jgi:hypothetical protein